MPKGSRRRRRDESTKQVGKLRGRAAYGRGKYQLQVVVEQDEDGLYVAECPALDGCYTQGKTFEEVIENIKDVIALCIEELRDAGKPIDLKYPEVIAIKQVEVTA
jgi:predicted RNase H-like HicB family nuclease